LIKKKKVTFSIDAKIYDSYREFCEKNAFLLSKKIEIYMREELKNEKK
jgi:hypothetical protein